MYSEPITEQPKADDKYPLIYWRTMRHWTDSTKAKIAQPDTHEQCRLWPQAGVEVLGTNRKVAPPYVQRTEDGQRVYLWVDKFGGIEVLKERRAL